MDFIMRKFDSTYDNLDESRNTIEAPKPEVATDDMSLLIRSVLDESLFLS